jgi:hypothetical protein
MSNKVEDFPSLNPNIKQMPKKQQGPTYAQLANDWKTHDEYMKGISVEEQSQPKFNRKQEENKFSPINVPIFEKCDRFEDEEIVEKSEEGEWIKVERVKKQKRELTLIEKYGDPDAPEEEETVWGGEEKPSHQTCWEDKR